MSKPSLGLIMLVRDEVDFVGPNLRFHHQQGFERFAVMVNAARDGTREELEELAETLPITIVDQPDTSFRQVEWATQLAHVLEEAGVDWGIRIDADEFIAAHECSLKDLIAEIDQPILCRRENVLPLVSDCRQPTYHPLRDCWLRVAKPLGVYPFRSPESPEPFPVVLRCLPGKVLFPLKGLVRVREGNHSVEHRRPTLRFLHEVLIRHYPVRRFDQFMRRLDHWEQRFERNPPSGGISVHIRRWLKLRQEGQIEKEYDNFSIPDADLGSLLERGTLVEDFFGGNLS